MKGKIVPSQTDALVSQIDLMSSLGQLIGSDIRTEDSQELTEVFLGKSQDGRTNLILEATSRTAFRKGNWVLIPPYKGPAVAEKVNIELGNNPTTQLYNLEDDLGQLYNLSDQYPEKLIELLAEFKAIRGSEYDQTKALELK